ncbi:MAG: sigma-70 family RNA polymerase sigma factor [Capsulimonadaceae bacterium]|nr:sigma-70 family RNA polymerase sigma factor [Capsulimonadaceae bacterium]
MPRDKQFERYKATVLPHLDAAHNLARWLAHDAHDAEDIAQEAALRAYRFIDDCRGSDPRAWLLSIVRNTAYAFLKKRKRNADALAEMILSPLEAPDERNPETLVMRKLDAAAIRSGLDEIPAEYREILVLREMEGMAYKEISEIVDIPIGTVMSRLARARKLLRAQLIDVASGASAYDASGKEHSREL